MNETSYGRRAAIYWFSDGLPEILFALTLIAMGVSATMLRVSIAGRWIKLDLVGVLVGILLYHAVERPMLDFLKSRITYPRTGYVEPPEELEVHGPTLTRLSLRDPSPVKENVTSFRTRTARWVVFLPIIVRDAGHWLVPIAMPVVGLALYLSARGTERPYRWWSILLLGITGPLSLLVDMPERLHWPLPFLLTGVWMLAEGSFRLVHYLRENPLPPAAAQGVRA